MLSFKFFFAFLMVLIFLIGCDGKELKLNPTNLIIISIDTLRADHLGCYGYYRPTSPTIDQLASEGLLFENMSTPSPWTMPAHMSLLTGLYPSRHAVKSSNVKLPDNIPTLASVCSENGFATAAVVNSLFLDKRYGFARGFDSYTRIAESHSPEGTAPTINTFAMKWLRQRTSKPFFLFLHYYDVHTDYMPLPRYKKQFVSSYNGIADGSTDQLSKFNKGMLSLNQRDIQHDADLYDAEIRQLDDQLKQFFFFLQEEGLWEQTLLIVTSDHGEEFLDHGGVLHGKTQYQEAIRVPFIIRGPEIPRSKRIGGNASLVDVMPTVLQLFDLVSPASQDGINLQPTWERRENMLYSRFVFAEANHNDKKRAVLHKSYKLHYDLLTSKMQLYDLAEDPKEKHDLADKKPSTSDLLFSELRQFMQIDNKGQPVPALPLEDIKKLMALGYIQ